MWLRLALASCAVAAADEGTTCEGTNGTVLPADDCSGRNWSPVKTCDSVFYSKDRPAANWKRYNVKGRRGRADKRASREGWLRIQRVLASLLSFSSTGYSAISSRSRPPEGSTTNHHSISDVVCVP